MPLSGFRVTPGPGGPHTSIIDALCGAADDRHMAMHSHLPLTDVACEEVAMRFRAAQRHMEDHLLWIQMAHAGYRMVMIELPLATLHKPAFGAGGQSAQLLAMERAELGNYRRLRSEAASVRPCWPCFRLGRWRSSCAGC